MAENLSLSASSSLRALVARWRERAAREHQQGNALDHVRDSQSYLYGCEHARDQCADELSAALDAQQEEENQSLRACQSENAREPEATPNTEAIRALVQDLDFAIDVTEPRDVILRRFADILERSPLWR
jgi:hypothetical protein